MHTADFRLLRTALKKGTVDHRSATGHLIFHQKLCKAVPVRILMRIACKTLMDLVHVLIHHFHIRVQKNRTLLSQSLFQHPHPVQHDLYLVVFPYIILVTEENVFVFFILQGFFHQPEKVSGSTACMLRSVVQKDLFRIPSGIIV